MLSSKKYGNQTGIPLVMIHGFLCGGSLFAPNIEEFSKQVEVITIDLPGYGESSLMSGVCSIKKMAEQVLETLTVLKREKFSLLGHSMGGMVALQIALLEPERVKRLILYATNSSGQLVDRFETFAQTKERIEQTGLDATRRYISKTWFKEGERNPYFKFCIQSGGAVSLETARASLDAMAAFDLSNQISKISFPVLILGAALDRSYSVDHLKKMQMKISKSHLYLMEDCAHNAHLENQIVFNQQVLNFLNEPSKIW